MFLDASKFLFIDGVGLFGYFPEFNRILFYKEKPDKRAEITDYGIRTIETQDNRYDIITCTYTSQKPVTKLSLKQRIKLSFVTEQSEKTIQFYSHHFNNVFVSEFEKLLSDAPTRKPDMSVMFLYKNTIKKVDVGHSTKTISSSAEPRIVLIKWNEMLLRYYGDEDISDVYDTKFVLPTVQGEKGKSYMSFSPTSEGMQNMISFLGNTDEMKDMVETYFDKLKYTGHLGYNVLPFMSTPIEQHPRMIAEHNKKRSAFFTQLLTHIKLKLFDFSTDYKIVIQLLESLDTSLLKGNWLKYARENLPLDSDSLKGLFHGSIKSKLTLKSDEEGLYTAGFNYYKYEIVKEAETKVTFNILDTDVTAEFNSCGATNCFTTITKDRDTLGIRFSKKFYKLESTEFYNALIEMLIQCVMDFTFNKAEFTRGITFPMAKIQQVYKAGFIPYTDETVGKLFCPYIIVKIDPGQTFTNVKDRIKKLNESESESESKLVKRFTDKFMLNVFNFYTLAWSLLNFQHGDFKPDNIVIDGEGDFYIIDFERSSLNILLREDKMIKLVPRIFEYDNPGVFMPGNTSPELGDYRSYMLSMIYRDKLIDADLEFFLWWVINLFGTGKYDEYRKHIKRYMSDIVFEKKPEKENIQMIFKETSAYGTFLKNHLNAPNTLYMRLAEIINYLVDNNIAADNLAISREPLASSSINEYFKYAIKDATKLHPRESTAGGKRTKSTKRTKRMLFVASKKTIKRRSNFVA